MLGSLSLILGHRRSTLAIQATEVPREICIPALYLGQPGLRDKFIQHHSAKVAKNGFRHEVDAKEGYRDMKTWVPVEFFM